MAGVSISKALIELGQKFNLRNWVPATSGNFSAVLVHEPLRLCITQSATQKGSLTTRSFVTIDDDAIPVGKATARPSAEARLHIAVVRTRKAGAVLHTHSVWSTMLSERHADQGGIALQGFEMLKGLDGVTTHEHREWLPIVENDQDMARLAETLAGVLGDHPEAHGLLLRGHGLYTWGRTIAEAERHVEALEFLLETVGRQNQE